MDTLMRYLSAIMEDGDYLNDWLTHLPELLQPYVLFIGYLVAMMTGG